MSFDDLDTAALKAIEKHAIKRAQIAFEASVESLVREVGISETIKRLRFQIDALTEFER